MAESDTFIPALHKPASLLPIARHKEALLYTIENNAITIVVGQTGSGKTTQLPQYLERAGWCNDGKIIAVTQARSFPPLACTTLPLSLCSQVDARSQPPSPVA
jgi:ATP-dependent RNA helicase DDX35